ncbi:MULTISPECIES: AraC family transcriptional regulator [unclassified Pseudomonas]|uniref:AraC family transcriptional regulator n=1 Tax=unclassified Pseudomonas TaxID=196821 RepID=UPI000D38D0EF|nr:MULTISPECIES: AraC family transcriptional regulator [unclassified Pseudomonas]RAU45738.1 AraC family transcriptional regulator [Pseudomonas sp. RIT 409]RAU56164.1 AraC family transcriptional regulator [Pseudomonas sp. RIT 412]
MTRKLPLFNERIYAPYKIAALVEVLSEQGIAPSASLQGSGLEEHQIADASVLTSVRQYAVVCGNAVSLSRDPATPFKTGARLHLSAYGMYGYALMSCLSLRDYFRLGVKYHALATPTLTIEWQEYEHEAVWTFPDASTPSPSKAIKQFWIEQQFTQHVTHLQDVFGQSCPPTQACFAYPAPAHSHLYSEYLGCPCVFDHDRCELRYDSSILDQKPHLAHPLTAAVLQETCERLIGQAKVSTGISGEVYQMMMQTPGSFPSMEDVAEALHMTTRSLRRKLLDEQTSFAAIVDDVRCSLATEYLKTTMMSTDDIALLLGFTEPTNFRRAFKRWTGQTTKAYRQT